MSGIKKRAMGYIFPILMMAASILAGCGQDTRLPQQADGGGQTAESPYMEKDDSFREESAAEVETAEESAAGPGILEEDAAGPETAEEALAASQESGEELPEEYLGSVEPELPATGRQLSDFVAEGWEIRDSVELDFNEDGIVDYVAVQEVPLDRKRDDWQNELSLRILFAIASDGEGQYRLDFQDANLIRARTEGGMMGDPFEPLEAEGTSFTTCASGGSSDRWTESHTYTYRDGTWYRTAYEYSDGYASNVDDYRRADWDSGILSCKIRGRTSNCPGEIVHDPGVYELEYEMRLDEPITLCQASRSWWLAGYRVTDCEVSDIVFAEGISIPKDRIIGPKRAYYYGVVDEDYACYSFSDEDSGKGYLALYNWQDGTLAVLAQEDCHKSWLDGIDVIGLYRDKIYYSTDIVETIRYRWTRRGESVIIEDEAQVGLNLMRMNLDGTGKETLFTYRYPGTDQPILEEDPPYMSIINATLSGGEIVFGIYRSNEDRPYYRMNVDGSGLQEMGWVSDEYPFEEST